MAGRQTSGVLFGGILAFALLALPGASLPPVNSTHDAVPAPLVPLPEPAELSIIETSFAQVHPEPVTGFKRSSGQNRVVVLIHGLSIQPFSKASAKEAKFRSWQKKNSDLVKTLSKQGDVFAFAYSQNAPVDDVARVPALRGSIRLLRELGYSDIVIIGHSAGGIIARNFVEDYPDTGVTKVIQICTPNLGSGCAKLEPGVTRGQRAFVRSLGKEGRKQTLEHRASKRIPDSVQFVCVVGDGAGAGDCIVSVASQWPSDLAEQGIPCVRTNITHFEAMRKEKGAEVLAQLLSEDLPRWTKEKVADARKSMRDE